MFQDYESRMRKSCNKHSFSVDDIVSVLCDVKKLLNDGYTFSLNLIFSLYLSTSHVIILLPNDIIISFEYQLIFEN